MMQKTFIWLLVLGWMGTGMALSQDKIGFLNMELVISYMPETEAMQRTLQAQQQKLAQQLRIKEEYAQSKLQEYYEGRQGGATEQELKPLEDELRKLDKEIQEFASDSDQKMMIKRQELLQPITEKLKKVIDEIAEKDGYDYILNAVDGSSVSVILHGPETDDLTRRVMEELGIEIPEAEEDNN